MTRANKKIKTGVLFVLCLLIAKPAGAELKIDITKAVVEPIPMAITNFVGANFGPSKYGTDIARVIKADLERSGLFRAIDAKAYIQKSHDIETLPRFGDWRLINAQALIHGRAHLVVDGRLRVEFRLWDVLAEQQMVGFVLTTVPNAWRRVAHIIADAVYKRLTGEEGYFDTRIVYVAEQGPPTRRVKRLAVMDQDGANHLFLTKGKSLVLTPRFSPTQQEITFLSYYGRVPRVYLKNLDTGREEILGDFRGMTFAPRFSPDGKSVIMSMAEDGNSEIYAMNLSTREVRRLTNHSAIDTSPSYSPDQRQIVFNSDRGGKPHLYVMSANGKKVRRISHGKGRYNTPVWSPRGDMIAFTKSYRGLFYIGVMYPDGSGERLLDKDFLVEAPTWAPNGRVLMFFRQGRTRADGTGGTTRLWSVDLTGENKREIVTPIDASDPAWSPLNR